jgi:hypothetical protein
MMNAEDVVESLMYLVIENVRLDDSVRKFDGVGLNPGEEGFSLCTVDGVEFQVTVVKAR